MRRRFIAPARAGMSWAHVNSAKKTSPRPTRRSPVRREARLGRRWPPPHTACPPVEDQTGTAERLPPRHPNASETADRLPPSPEARSDFTSHPSPLGGIAASAVHRPVSPGRRDPGTTDVRFPGSGAPEEKANPADSPPLVPPSLADDSPPTGPIPVVARRPATPTTGKTPVGGDAANSTGWNRPSTLPRSPRPPPEGSSVASRKIPPPGS
jgi:hypothetical protein